MGPGRIAHKFAQSLKCSEAAEMTAVGSRSIERAEKFAERVRRQPILTAVMPTWLLTLM